MEKQERCECGRPATTKITVIEFTPKPVCKQKPICTECLRDIDDADRASEI